MTTRRLMTLASLTGDHALIRRLQPLFTSDAGALSQMYSDVSLLITVLRRLPSPPWDVVAKAVLDMQRQLRQHMRTPDGFKLARELQPLYDIYFAATKANSTPDTHGALALLSKLRTALKPSVASHARRLLRRLPGGANGALEELRESARGVKKVTRRKKAKAAGLKKKKKHGKRRKANGKMRKFSPKEIRVKLKKM